MSSFVVVVVQPELKPVLNVFEVVRRLDVSPVELSFHGLVKSFNLPIVFWSVRGIYNKLDSIVCEAISERLRIESIVGPYSLDPSWEFPNESCNEIHSILDCISLVYPCNDEP